MLKEFIGEGYDFSLFYFVIQISRPGKKKYIKRFIHSFFISYIFWTFGTFIIGFT